MYSAERQFVTTANSQLHLLAQDELHPHHCVEAAISEIKTAAGPVKARAVYRAALLCEDVLKRSDDTTSVKFQASLNSLKSLVTLYANGLYEIDPDFKSRRLDEDSLETLGITEEQISEQLKADNENAANLLKPLLHLVQNEKQAGALSFLAGIKHQPANKIAVRSHTRTNVRFDTLMRRITNQALGEARALAKNVSISYAADFETVDNSISSDLQDLLQTTCMEIVRCGLVVNGDLAASMNRTWQISITGETQGQNLSVSLAWPGEKLLGFGNTGTSNKSLQNLDGKFTETCDIHNADNELSVHTLEFVCPARKSEKAVLKQLDILQPLVREG